MDEEFNAGEVELLLSDMSEVERKVVDVLKKVFGNDADSSYQGTAWLLRCIRNNPSSNSIFSNYVNNVVTQDIKRIVDKVVDDRLEQMKRWGQNERGRR